MITSSFLFATMGVCVKFASQYFTSAELVFYRGALGIVFMAAYAHAGGTSLKTSYPAMHAWRSVIGVVSLSAWFYAIANLPLATAMTLNYMSSVWIAAFLVGGALMLWRPATTQTAAAPGRPKQGRPFRGAAHHTKREAWGRYPIKGRSFSPYWRVLPVW